MKRFHNQQNSNKSYLLVHNYGLLIDSAKFVIQYPINDTMINNTLKSKYFFHLSRSIKSRIFAQSKYHKTIFVISIYAFIFMLVMVSMSKNNNFYLRIKDHKK
jgi:hypothetical protein